MGVPKDETAKDADQFAWLRMITIGAFSIFLDGGQAYLGRCYVWLNREVTELKFSALTDRERAAYWVLVEVLEDAITAAFGVDQINWAWLANTARHWHIHAIPRYAEPKFFAGVEFVDKNQGKNYAPYEKMKFPRALIEQIRDHLKAAIEATIAALPEEERQLLEVA